jgi:ABC-type bacteriocin/lantibiotic exporter with double-glycine peptidase domain
VIPYINIPVNFPISTSTIVEQVQSALNIPKVPFFSQFQDIQSSVWQKKGCGVASLAMLIEYYKPGTVSVNKLLDQGITNGAYLQSAGWTYKGLIQLGNKYGLDGESYDLSVLNEKAAFEQFEKYLKDGPVIASVHYKFDPKSTIPHLVVINGISNDIVYYNDPAAKTGKLTISVEDFLKAWKKRFIVVRPANESQEIAMTNKSS